MFYLLPPVLTDELLPQTISPTPAELVRVMVGRLEIMTPESEQHVRDVVLASSRHRRAESIRRAALIEAARNEAQPIPEFKEPVAKLPEALGSLGRLAEPALVRAKYYSTDAVIQQEAGLLLNSLHQQSAEQPRGKVFSPTPFPSSPPRGTVTRAWNDDSLGVTRA